MLADWIGLISLTTVNVGASVGIYRYFNGQIDKFRIEIDNKISRVYSRLDEVKKSNNETFMNKDMCQVLHDSTASNLQGTEKRIDARLDKFEARMEMAVVTLDQKITNQMEQIFLILKNGK
jgi:hypothetical protein